MQYLKGRHQRCFRKNTTNWRRNIRDSIYGH